MGESIAGVAQRQQELESIVLVDGDGRALMDGRGDASLPRWWDLHNARPPRAMRLGPLQRHGGEWLLPLAVPMRDGRWIVARLRTTELQRLLDDLDLEKTRLIQLGGQRQKRYFFNVGMARKFMQTFLVSEACKELIDAGKTTSIRDLYYVTKHTIGDTRQNTFEEQDESDPIIEDLEVTVDALREELHLFAARKGSMVGPLTIVDSGDTIDLRRMGSGGWAVPSIVEENVIAFRKHEAKYVLLIEKDAVWTRFNEDKFWKRNSCIIVQGGGQPPRGVRRLVRRLHSELKLPVYVLVDNDPWGFYIYSVMKQGSINLAYESMRMAVPDAAVPSLWVVRPLPPLREIASRVSTTRETVARSLGQLYPTGLLRRKGRMGKRARSPIRAPKRPVRRGWSRRGSPWGASPQVGDQAGRATPARCNAVTIIDNPPLADGASGNDAIAARAAQDPR